jgi:transketolase
MSLQRVAKESSFGERVWIGPKDAVKLDDDDAKQHHLAHAILCHLAVQAPTEHASGHPGGPLSSFDFAYALAKRRDPHVDQPLRYSAGHLSVLAYGLQWLFGREGKDARLANPAAIIEHFRTPSGLPGHVEAGIGDIPFGTGPLGKGVSHGLGTAFGLNHTKKRGIVDVLLADGDCQEGQVMEAFRLAAHLQLGNLMVHVDLNDVQLSGLPSQTVAADVAAIVHACGWHVIEVQDGNAIGQVTAALDRADALAGKDRPICIIYYTTMGSGIPLMEEGSNTGKANWHGTPLKKEQAVEALAHLPELTKLVSEYDAFQRAEKKRYTSGMPTVTNIELKSAPRQAPAFALALRTGRQGDISLLSSKCSL